MDRLRSILYLQSELNSSFINTGHVYQNFKHIIASYYAHQFTNFHDRKDADVMFLKEFCGLLHGVIRVDGDNRFAHPGF